MIEHVLESARRNWHVFPLWPMQKTPRLKEDWKDIATTDEKQITKWWAEFPNANYGIATGPSKLVVIDLDVPKGPLIKDEAVQRQMFGIEAWCWLVMNAGKETEPRSFEVWTPSGGEHIYWQANEAMSVKNSASKLGPGIDVRADGGYVVGPGSKTEKGIYEIQINIGPKPLPIWLRKLLADARAATTPVQETYKSRRDREKRIANSDSYAASALKGELQNIAATPIGVGQRNNQLNQSAFKLKKYVDNGSLNGNDVADELYNAAMSIQMDSNEAINTIKSGLGV